VRALVYIGSNNNHGGCLLHCEVTVGPVGGHISVGGGATLLSSHAGRSFTPDADKSYARQAEGGRNPTSQAPGDQDPTTATRHCHPDTEPNPRFPKVLHATKMLARLCSQLRWSGYRLARAE
jgi:hypothetical protein